MDNTSRRVAILYICTGKYVVFWKNFYKSCEKNLLKNCNKEYIVFTDAKKIYMEDNPHVYKIYQDNLGWPDNTLKRFGIFLKRVDLLEKYDYIFFFNANAVIKKKIEENEFLPDPSDLMVVKHPGYFDKNKSEYPYERNEKSLAFIPEKEGEHYICGGVNGGKATAFIKLIKELNEAILEDEKNGIIAIWHDESHINKYVNRLLSVDRDSVKVLSPSYCYPQGWALPFDKKVIIREKSLFIDVETIKENGETKGSVISSFKLFFKRIIFSMRVLRSRLHAK